MLDISRVLSGETDLLVFQKTYPLTDVSDDISGGVLDLKGGVSNRSGYIEFNAEVTASYFALCARCGEPFEGKLHFSLSHPVTEKLENADKDQDEYLIPQNGELCVGEIGRSGVILHLPPRLLCRDTCKGLCQDCGVNLNTHRCTCVKKTGDPRMAKLKDYFKKE